VHAEDEAVAVALEQASEVTVMPPTTATDVVHDVADELEVELEHTGGEQGQFWGLYEHH
jgi:hypothetical protein